MSRSSAWQQARPSGIARKAFLVDEALHLINHSLWDGRANNIKRLFWSPTDTRSVHSGSEGSSRCTDTNAR
jgi:hypothetical protein